MERLAPKFNRGSSSQVAGAVGAGEGVCSGIKMKKTARAELDWRDAGL